ERLNPSVVLFDAPHLDFHDNAAAVMDMVQKLRKKFPIVINDSFGEGPPPDVMRPEFQPFHDLGVKCHYDTVASTSAGTYNKLYYIILDAIEQHGKSGFNRGGDSQRKKHDS